VIPTEEQAHYKYPDINLTPTELIKAGCQKLSSEVQEITISVWENKIAYQWKEPPTVSFYFYKLEN
jgi:hypothetical protein